MREWRFRELSSQINFPARVGPCPSLHYPPSPRKVCLWCITFALLATNGPLPAELKIKGEHYKAALNEKPTDSPQWFFIRSSIKQFIVWKTRAILLFTIKIVKIFELHTCKQKCIQVSPRNVICACRRNTL